MTWRARVPMIDLKLTKEYMEKTKHICNRDTAVGSAWIMLNHVIKLIEQDLDNHKEQSDD